MCMHAFKKSLPFKRVHCQPLPLSAHNAYTHTRQTCPADIMKSIRRALMHARASSVKAPVRMCVQCIHYIGVHTSNRMDSALPDFFPPSSTYLLQLIHLVLDVHSSTCTGSLTQYAIALAYVAYRAHVCKNVCV